MEEFMAALQEQLEYMVDADTNTVDSFSQFDSTSYLVTTEDGAEFMVEVTPQ